MLKKVKNEIILSQTENIPTERSAKKKIKGKDFLKAPIPIGNKNILVIGGSGSGKTRLFVTPNLMQMNSSYVISDSSGLVLSNVGKLLAEKGNYRIKTFNLRDYKKSMHYNPFAYIGCEQDIYKMVDVIIANTNGVGEKSSEDFWIKAERLLYTALISYIYYESPEYEQNFSTLIYLITNSVADNDDEHLKVATDFLFEQLEEKNPKHFAVAQYKKYKWLAGNYIKSIPTSCAIRLEVFEDEELKELMSYDELELDALGGKTKEDKQKSALFISFPVSYRNMSLITAMLYTQIFNVLNDRADDVFEGSLPIPVHFIMDDFSFIGRIPNFDKLIVTLKGRAIWVSITIKCISEIRRIYNGFYEIIEYFDNILYFGKIADVETVKFIQEYLGVKEEVGINKCLVARIVSCSIFARSMTYSFSDKYDITKHRFYRFISDYDKDNRFSIEKYIEEAPLSFYGINKSI